MREEAIAEIAEGQLTAFERDGVCVECGLVAGPDNHRSQEQSVAHGAAGVEVEKK